jgi:hypothetical protein
MTIVTDLTRTYLFKVLNLIRLTLRCSMRRVSLVAEN